MGKREMDAIKRLFYVFTIILSSCDSSPKDLGKIDGLSYVMSDYYLNHLAYPIDGEQFCYKFYKQDSICGFRFIDERVEMDEEFASCALFAHDSHQYSGYVKTMKKLADIWINNPFAEELKIIGYIFSDAESIKFEETDSFVVMFDKRRNIKALAEKLQLWANEYINNKYDWKESCETFGPDKMGYVHNFYHKLNLYTRDSLFIVPDNPQIIEDYSKRLFELTNMHYDKPMNIQSLIYYGSNNYTNSHGDTAFIQTMIKDTMITSILDSIILCDNRIFFAKFHFH